MGYCPFSLTMRFPITPSTIQPIEMPSTFCINKTVPGFLDVIRFQLLDVAIFVVQQLNYQAKQAELQNRVDCIWFLYISKATGHLSSPIIQQMRLIVARSMLNDFPSLMPGSLYILVPSFFIYCLSRMTKTIFYVCLLSPCKARQAKWKFEK